MSALGYRQYGWAMPFTSWSGYDPRVCTHQVLEACDARNDRIKLCMLSTCTTYGDRLSTDVAVRSTTTVVQDSTVEKVSSQRSTYKFY